MCKINIVKQVNYTLINSILEQRCLMNAHFSKDLKVVIRY